MQFTIPTTKEQMYAVLDEIFNYYRIQRDEYEEPELGELVLSRLEFTPLNKEQLNEKAAAFLAAEQEREINALISDINAKLTSARQTIENAGKSAEEQIEQVNELYVESEEKLKKIALNV